ncbi:hypothetical protein C8J57DRAFT_1298478 [Mycena rebaudengoi]|nr:hypothetical protein C8J57DRAFT_1298478 [Mycena rebaudengoi]
MSTSTVAVSTPHATLPPRRARYHDLDTNAPQLELRSKKYALQDDLARQGPHSTRKQRLADGINKLQRQIDSPSSHSQLERMLAELRDQQSREIAELASYYGKLEHSRAQTLLPELLSEIFRQCAVPSPQEFSWGPLNLEMTTLLNLLRVCSTWRAVALETPDLWCELTYTDTGTLPLAFYDQWLSRAATVTLDLNIWPSLGYGEDSYWSGATQLLHKHCNAIETFLRNLTVHSYDTFIHSSLLNIPWSGLSRLELRVKYDTRVISPTQLADILTQAQNLTHLLINLGPDDRFGPSSPQVLPLLILTLWRSRGSTAKIVPIFLLNPCTFNCGPPFLPHFRPRTHLSFLRKQASINSLYWESHNCDLPEVVEALTYTGLGSETLLPNLIDISLGLNSYEGLLPAFADMVASRRVSESPPRAIALLRSFHLKAYIPYRESDNFPDFEDSEEDPPPQPSLSDEVKDANEKASRRLLDLCEQGLPGSLDFQHLDQALQFTEPHAVEEAFVEASTNSESLLLDWDEDILWHWVDPATLHGQEWS